MRVESDFLIIGSGVAGLMFALKAAKAGTVALVTKKTAAESNTNYAQGGIASVFDKLDSYDAHIADTLQSGNDSAIRMWWRWLSKMGRIGSGS